MTGLLSIIWPTLAAAAVALLCLGTWPARPNLQRSSALRVGLMTSVFATVGLGLVAGIEIIARVLTFGMADAF